MPKRKSAALEAAEKGPDNEKSSSTKVPKVSDSVE